MNDLVVLTQETTKVLGSTKAQLVLDQYKDYFAVAAEWEPAVKAIIVTDESQVEMIEKAKNGRKFLSKKRIALEATRKTLKDNALQEGRVIDGIANTLKGLIEPMEAHLKKQEDFVENQIRERKNRLHNERFERIKEYIELPSPYDFREMSDEIYEALFAAKKKTYEEKKDLEARLEIERIEKVAREAEEQRKMKEENERLRKENEEKERIAKAEREKHQKQIEEQEKSAKAEREKLEKKLAAEKARADAERKATEEKARKAREEHDKAMRALQEQLKNTVTCPNCQHKFVIERK